MEGKTCLITGSSRGIGFYTALGLAQKGAQVILVSHNEEHCKQAQERINNAVSRDAACFYVANLSIMANVRHFAENIRKDYEFIDVLVNNVGGWFPKYENSPEGIEMTFALNHLSYFLLTGLLLDALKKSKTPRIVNVSSEAHRQVDGIRFEDIQFKENYRAFPAYAQSKLANLMFTYKLAEFLKSNNVIVNTLHPGFVGSKLYRRYGFFSPLIEKLILLIAKTPEEGAETPIYLASSPDVSGINGKYFVDRKEKRTSDTSYDRDAWERLWDLSEEMTDFEYSILPNPTNRQQHE